MFNATGNSTQQAAILPSQYVGRGGTDGRPISFYVQLGDDFTWDRKDFSIESPSEPNCAARGIWTRILQRESESAPELRSRSFRDSSRSLTQFSLYGEGQFGSENRQNRAGSTRPGLGVDTGATPGRIEKFV